MTKKSLFIALLFAICAAIVFAAARLWYNRHADSQTLGHYAFAQIKPQVGLISRLQFITSDGNEINIVRTDDYWHFKEAENYYANNQMLLSFYAMINNALIIDVREIRDNQLTSLRNKSTQMNIFDNENRLMEQWLIAEKPDNQGRRLAHKNQSNYIYTLSNVGIFSGAAADWVPMPLISVAENVMSGMTLNGKFISTDIISKSAKSSAFAQKLLESVQFMRYEGIMTKADFANSITDIPPHKLSVHTIPGLIYELNVYKVADSYWLTINLAREKISRREIPELIENLRNYYDDWAFHLDKEQGEILYQTQKDN